MQQETTKPMPMVLELFGHSRIAGYVSEATFAGAPVVRVDVPQIGDTPPFTKMFHPNAVYAFNPVDEETMVYVAEQCRVKPITVFDMSEMRRKMMTSLPEEAFTGEDVDDDNDENGDDEEDGTKW